MRIDSRILLACLAMGLHGCQETLVRRSDQQVYDLVKQRQHDALGITSDMHIGPETGELRRSGQMYNFTPHPIDSTLPEAFQTAPPERKSSTDLSNGDMEASPGVAAPAEDPASVPAALPGGPPAEQLVGADPTAAPVEELMSPSIFEPEIADQIVTFGLADALAYADRYARELQNAKEDLYLEALALTLERHLWTPQFVAAVQANYTNFGQITEFDQAMSAVSDFAVSQRLPFGGDVSARVINSLVRDLSTHTTTGESGNFIIEANLPLLRGAGRAAFESRYTAERELIYAVRTYERFRRSFLVSVADNYFDLQQRSSGITNAYLAYESRYRDWQRADFINRTGLSRDIFDAPRAKSSFRQAEAGLVSAKEQYATALDLFKIFIGMPMDTPLDVLRQDADDAAEALEALLPNVDGATAESVAINFRLDLLNSADRIDDANRGVNIAKNAILPDLNIGGSVALDSDPDRFNSTGYNTERATWRGDVSLRMDDRKTERNAYRAALVNTRRAERNYDQFADTVRAEVRRSLRRIQQQETLIDIQAMNVKENEFRVEAARAQFLLGMTTNRDVVEAENDLLDARNEYASAVSSYRSAILAFRLATGTLRVTDDGHWEQPQVVGQLGPGSRRP